MPQAGFRLWLVAVVIATAVTVLLGLVLRAQWPAAIADPIAQAVGFTVSFLIAWPWFKSQSSTNGLNFRTYVAFITAIAVVMAFVRIRYMA